MIYVESRIDLTSVTQVTNEDVIWVRKEIWKHLQKIDYIKFKRGSFIVKETIGRPKFILFIINCIQ